MKRKLLSLLPVLALLLCCAFAVSAEETEDVSGEADDGVSCGEGIGWYVDGTTLTVYGTGEMADFENGAPWKDFQDSLTRVVLENGISYVGAHAFENFDKLTEVSFGSDLKRIGPSAFASCDGLTSVHLPASFKKFGEKSFYSCKNLKEIHCDGSFPRFDENCLWDTYCKIYFPVNAPWSVIYIEQLETAFQGRIEFLASDGSDPYTPTEPREETTEASTVPETEAVTETTAETTEAPTVETTEEPSTEPETTAETQPETTAEATRETFLFGTQETTEAPTQPQKSSRSGAKIGIAIVAAVLAVIGIAAMVFSLKERRR